MQLLNQRSAHHGDDQSQDYIDDGNLPAENAHQQDQTSQIYHGGGNQKRECDAQGQARAGETDEQWNRRAGAERRYRAQKGCDAVCNDAMKPAEDLFRALRREVALNVGDDQNQNAQQDHDFYGIVEKELDAAAHLACRIQAAGLKPAANQPAQPFHTKDFILEEIPPGS